MTPVPHSRRQQAKLYLRRLSIGLCAELLRFASKPFAPREATALVIAPHQDDETLGCGGLIARKRNEGLPVHVAFITDGAASHPGHPRVTPSELSLLRRREAMQAMAALGVESLGVHFLDEPDGTLNVITPGRREALVQRLAELLVATAPEEIFLPCFPDGSSEHDATFGFVIEAILRTPLRPDVWQYPVWSWWNPVLMLRRWARSQDCRRLPLEDYAQGKFQAIDCYKTQLMPLAPDTGASLPAALVGAFRAEAEFFFRYDLPARKP